MLNLAILKPSDSGSSSIQVPALALPWPKPEPAAVRQFRIFLPIGKIFKSCAGKIRTQLWSKFSAP
jgi:hypothetical protein